MAESEVSRSSFSGSLTSRQSERGQRSSPGETLRRHLRQWHGMTTRCIFSFPSLETPAETPVTTELMEK